MRLINTITQLGGVWLIAYAFYYSLAQGTEQQPLYYVLHLPSFILVSCILVGILLASEGLSRCIEIIGQIFTSPNKIEIRLKRLQSDLEKMSEVYYKDGASGLKNMLSNRSYVPKVWNIVINQLESKLAIPDIQLLLKYSAIQFENRINQHIQILNILSAISPSAGVIGTVIGLIKLLSNLKDLSSLGSNMALALITTLYGVFFGTIIFKPIIARAENIKKLSLQTYDQANFWVNMINNRKPSFYFNPKYFDSGQKKQ